MPVSTTHADARAVLADSLTRRVPTWEIAASICDLGLDLPGDVRHELSNLAGTRRSRDGWAMHDDFDRVDDAADQLRVFAVLFPEVPIPASAHVDPDGLDALVRDALDRMGLHRMLPSAAAAIRHAKDLAEMTPYGISGLRKRLRFLRRLEEKSSRMRDALRLRHAQMRAKSRLAHMVDADACDDLTLAFVAYLAARANRRSVFMVGEQSRAQDTLSDGLLAAMEASRTTAWEQVAHVLCTEQVLGRVDAAGRGRLIGIYHAAMVDAAQALAGLWPSLPERMRDEMVMVKGVDSSRWNAYAGALNTMRSAWIAAMTAAGMEAVLDGYLPGKAPRLMASDLVWMYRDHGQELHEDTRLFAVLPRPWDVIGGAATMTRADVIAAAERLGVVEEAAASGWYQARAPHGRERPSAEPALVHGVVVADAAFADVLRRCGAFSGGQLRDARALAGLDVTRASVRGDGSIVPVVRVRATTRTKP